MKTRIPAPIASNVDSISSGGIKTAEAGGKMLGNATAKLVSMFEKEIDIMNKIFKSLITNFALAAALTFSGGAMAYQPPQEAPVKTTTKAAAVPTPSDKDIADAQSKGLVWVNMNTKVYHNDGQLYGKTKHGQFMSQADAQKAGYRAAKVSAAGKKKSNEGKK